MTDFNLWLITVRNWCLPSMLVSLFFSILVCCLGGERVLWCCCLAVKRMGIVLGFIEGKWKMKGSQFETREGREKRKSYQHTTAATTRTIIIVFKSCNTTKSLKSCESCSFNSASKSKWNEGGDVIVSQFCAGRTSRSFSLLHSSKQARKRLCSTSARCLCLREDCKPRRNYYSTSSVYIL